MKHQKVSRREFFTMTTLAAAGAYVALHPELVRAMIGGGAMKVGAMGGECLVSNAPAIDPPPGTNFFDIPTAKKDQSGSYQLRMEETALTLNGTPATLLTYNGMYPGPVIRASRGETLKVRMINMLPKTTALNLLGHTRNITNLQSHGLHASPAGMADNMMRLAAPGETLDYVYHLQFEQPGHLNFYHPHLHGTAAEQYWGGLAGPLLIEDTAASPLADLETHIMFIKDITISQGAAEPYSSNLEYMRGKEGNLVMVNGRVNPVLQIRPGQVQRWQIVNACNSRFLKLALERHSLCLIGTDGGQLDKPYPLSSILLAPGERIDLLVKADQEGGSFKLHSLPYDRGCGNLQQVTLLTLDYSGTCANDHLPAAVNPQAERPSLDLFALPRRQMTLSMMLGKGYINGISFKEVDHASKIKSTCGSYEVWEIFNQSNMDHPFHQHVNPCQVISITGGDESYASLYSTLPALKDVVIIPKMGSATLLVPVLDYSGITRFHCQIFEHEDIGMMGVWDISEKAV
jgi:FtsP/CotA-like multicopper oxidase with cupredoxin domain